MSAADKGQDPEIPEKHAENISEIYPLDVQLLLCQLVQDASREDSTWQEIYSRFIAHPVLTLLHQQEQKLILSTCTEEEITEVVTKIINSVMENANQKVRSRRGPKCNNGTSASSHTTTELTPDHISLEDSLDLSYFHLAGSKGREVLTRCCTLLHNACVSEIRKKLEANKKEFAKVLRDMASQ